MRYPIILFILFMPRLVMAQQATPPLTKDQAIAQAVRNNPHVSAAIHDAAAADQGARSARALANPQILFTPSITGLGSDTEFIIQQPLEINGSRSARASAAVARRRAATADAVTNLRQLVFDTQSAYFELARAREQVALVHDLLATTEQFDKLTRQQVELGSRPAIEQTQSAIELTHARQQSILAQAQEERARAALDTLMGESPVTPIGTLDTLPTSYPTVDHDTALRHALNARSEITSAREIAAAFRQDAKQARAEGLPDLAPQYRASRVTHGVHDAGFGLAITLPLLDYGSRQGRVRQNEELAKAQEDRATAVSSQVTQEVEQAFVQTQAADSILKDYPDGLLGQSQALLDASRLGYEAGRTTITAYLDAQRTYRQVHTDFIDAQLTSALAHVELEHATAAYPVTAIINDN